jgi:beta-barrel assembly-enhancing protease
VKWFWIISILVIALMTAIPAYALPKAQDIAAYRALVAQDLRLATIGYRLAHANRSFCDKTERNPGFVLHDILQYPNPETARAAFGFSQPVIVSVIIPNSAADLAGLEVGDGLVGLANEKWDSRQSSPKNAYERVSSIKSDIRHHLAATDDITLQVDRAGQPLKVTIKSSRICASDYQIDTVGGKDAGADGYMVSVSIGLARYATDNEFAAIVAHELSHNILDHRARLDAMKGNSSKSQIKKAILETEIEADRLSVWLLVNAGYDPQGAVHFALRCSKDSCLGLFSDSSHLGWKKRAEIMLTEIELIKGAAVEQGLKTPPILR